MPTLYVENIPEELYESLRQRARGHRKSISAEVLSLLEEAIPTPSEIARRKEFIKRTAQIRARKSPSPGPFPSAEEMQREDRSR